jgi:hypothetical protein
MIPPLWGQAKTANELNRKVKKQMATVRQDERGWTHIDWTLTGVTPNMIDWSWSNMDKTFILWHPVDHRGFKWYIPVTKDKFFGAIHLTLQGPYREDEDIDELPFGLRFYDIATLPKEMADVIIYDHVCLVGGVPLDNPDGPVSSYRIHQCASSDDGVVGMSSALTPIIEDVEEEKARGLAWTKHAIGEISNWEVFLPDLYKMWQVVKQPNNNIFHSLKIEKTATGVRYVNASNM